MVYIDVHCHLDWKSFDPDREELVDKMREQNILAISNTLNKENYLYTKSLFSFTDRIHVCPGLYPQEAEKLSEVEFEDYLNYIESIKDEIVAIGEIGLDRHETKRGERLESGEERLEVQERRFRKLIELGIKLDKPLIIHTRKMEQRALEIIREYVEKYNFHKFNLHCFTGKKKLIKDIKELKIYCSIPLIVKNTESFRMLVENLAMSQILVETDSPFLNPSKERNTPLSVPLIYEEIASIKGYDRKEIENIIYRNYQKLFK